MSKFLKNCTYCNSEYRGRVDSLFCSVSCRSNHWQRNKRALIKPEIKDLNVKSRGRRKLYIASQDITISTKPSIVSCFMCSEKGEIGLFYLGFGQNYIRCDNCGLTFKKEPKN
jgi:hypothetical protein